jgi:hypothetical protein
MVSNKIKNMKQLLPLFLFLLPCLAWAQYPSNGNQKITLGEQTTADGLIYRGVASTDTVRKPSIDTMAYMVLDTTTNIMWHYKKATSNAWLRVGGSITSGLTGVLPVANGGTNTTTLTANKVMVGNGTSGVLTPTNLHWDNTTGRLGINNSNPLTRFDLQADALNTVAIFRSTNPSAIITFGSNNSTLDGGFPVNGIGATDDDMKIYTNNAVRFTIKSDGKTGIGIESPTQALHVVGNASFTAVGAGAYANDLNITSTGVLTTASSDEKYKYNILPINYGLNTILQLNPVNFQWIKGEENDLGFIAQDVAEIIPEAVDTNWNSDLLMRYESIIPILTKAIQEQNALIKALEQRIINLENK